MQGFWPNVLGYVLHLSYMTLYDRIPSRQITIQLPHAARDWIAEDRRPLNYTRYIYFCTNDDRPGHGNSQALNRVDKSGLKFVSMERLNSSNSSTRSFQ